MKAIILLEAGRTIGSGHLADYVTGIFIAILILGYLLYSLIKPEKF